MIAAKLLPTDPRDRQRVDHFELVGEIASGGMATVYLARRAGMGGFHRFVAVKRLHPHLASETEFVQMFLDEARLAAMIHHPNVVAITEVGASDRGYYLVMDYVEGDTLARLLAQSAEAGLTIPLRIGLRILIDMLAGLHAAHELRDDQGQLVGLVHRDVSPQNVLVGLDGITRLTDFGVARATSRLAGTRVGQLKGKIAYMAPEQAAGDEMLDRRADVFSAGVLLWEMLTGRRLFRASNDAATLSRVVFEKIEPPTRYATDLDPQIAEVCMRALARPLPERIPSAAAFAEQLEAAAARSGGVSAVRDVASYMQSAFGGDFSRQRDAIRRWVSASESSDCGAGSISSPVRSSIFPAESRSSGQYDASLESSLSTALRQPITRAAVPSGAAAAPLGRRNQAPLIAAVGLLGVALAGAAAMLAFGDDGLPSATSWARLSTPASLGTSVGRGALAQLASLRADFLQSSKADGRPAHGSFTRQSTPSGAHDAPPSTEGRSEPKHDVSRPTKPEPTKPRPSHADSSGVDLSNPYR